MISKGIPEVVISAEVNTTEAIKLVTNKEYFIMKAAEFLRNDILTLTIENDIDDSITWPPTVSLLEERKPLVILCNFPSNILKKSRDSINPEKTQRLIDSLAANIIS